MPSLAAAVSAWALSVSGSRSVMRAVRSSSAATGSGAGGRLVAGECQRDAVAGEMEIDAAVLELTVQLLDSLGEHLHEAHPD